MGTRLSHAPAAPHTPLWTCSWQRLQMTAPGLQAGLTRQLVPNKWSCTTGNERALGSNWWTNGRAQSAMDVLLAATGGQSSSLQRGLKRGLVNSVSVMQVVVHNWWKGGK